MIDVAAVEQMNLEEIARFWVDFESEVEKDCGAAREILEAGKPIYYSKNGRDIVREWPDGRCEIVTIDATGTIKSKEG